jgi:lipoprotein NlpI/transglutaminase-like putative cysteine protease
LPALLYAQTEKPLTAIEVPVKEVQVAAGAFSLGDAPAAWVEPVAIPPTANTQPVVVQLADTQFHIGSETAVYVHRAIKINDAASLSEAGQLPITFVPDYQKLRLHAIRILRGSEILDRTRSSSVRFLQRESGLERGVYSGQVTASVLVSDLRVGDTLEYLYSTEGTNPVFDGRFFDIAGWDQHHPVELRRVVVSYPAARSIAWRFIGGTGTSSIAPAEATSGTRRTLRFEERSIPASRIEPYTPPDHIPFRVLQFSEFSRWQDVVKWAQPLFELHTPIDADVLQVVEKLKRLPAVEDRVVGALEFVQSEIRYFSVSLGESSHRPSHPNAVLARRYGDCKDKSLLLITLLKELGIDAKPVLLQIGTRKGLERSLASPQLFDHVIVQARVADRVFYLDPTRLGQRGRLARMGQVHEGAQVLVVTAETQALAKISSPNAPALARDELSETITLEKFGSDAQIESRHVWNGVAAEAMRVVYARTSRADIGRYLVAHMEQRYPGAKMIGEPQLEDQVQENVVILSTRYTVPNFAVQDRGNWFVRVAPTNFANTFALAPETDRLSPVVVPGHPLEARYSLEVRFPEEVRAVRDPYNQTIRNGVFAYTIAASFRGRTAKTTLDLKTFADRIEVHDLKRFRDDLDKVTKIPVARIIVVGKSDIKTGSVLGLGRKDFKQTLRDRLRETIEKTTETIRSANLTGEDLANAYCDRSNAHSDLGEYEAALRDANDALKLVPNSTRMLACRAEAYFAAGEFQRSAADYSKSLSLGAVNATTYHRRGLARFYHGDLEGAVDDLRKASEIEPNKPDLYVDLWLTWASKRLGKPLPEAVLQRALAEPQGEWPRPALAMLNGKLAPDDMLKLLDRKSGDDLQMARAEGYFYLGQHFLLQGDKSKAREYFEKTRDIGVLMYMEHVAARFELERLERSE